MCGRYFIAPTLEDVAALRGFLEQVRQLLEKREQLSVTFSGEVSPGMAVPAIANDRACRLAGFAMSWGLPKPGGGPGLVINARSETAPAKRLFAEACDRHRCLLPASWYFEWGPADDKRKRALRPAGEECCLLAGLYARPSRPGELARYAVLTRQAVGVSGRIHDRMPVVVPLERMDGWLDLARPYDQALSVALTDMELLACE